MYCWSVRGKTNIPSQILMTRALKQNTNMLAKVSCLTMEWPNSVSLLFVKFQSFSPFLSSFLFFFNSSLSVLSCCCFLFISITASLVSNRWEVRDRVLLVLAFGSLGDGWGIANTSLTTLFQSPFSNPNGNLRVSLLKPTPVV